MNTIAKKKVKYRKAARKRAAIGQSNQASSSAAAAFNAPAALQQSTQESSASASTAIVALQHSQLVSRDKLDAHDNGRTDVSTSLGTNWQEAAINRFFDDYAVPSDVVEGHLDWLSQNYES